MTKQIDNVNLLLALINKVHIIGSYQITQEMFEAIRYDIISQNTELEIIDEPFENICKKVEEILNINYKKVKYENGSLCLTYSYISNSNINNGTDSILSKSIVTYLQNYREKNVITLSNFDLSLVDYQTLQLAIKATARLISGFIKELKYIPSENELSSLFNNTVRIIAQLLVHDKYLEISNNLNRWSFISSRSYANFYLIVAPFAFLSNIKKSYSLVIKYGKIITDFPYNERMYSCIKKIDVL